MVFIVLLSLPLNSRCTCAEPCRVRPDDLCPHYRNDTGSSWNLGEPCIGETGKPSRLTREIFPGPGSVEILLRPIVGLSAMARNPLCWREALGYRCQSFPRNGAP